MIVMTIFGSVVHNEESVDTIACWIWAGVMLPGLIAVKLPPVIVHPFSPVKSTLNEQAPVFFDERLEATQPVSSLVPWLAATPTFNATRALTFLDMQ
jgi:hypothetical protein